MLAIDAEAEAIERLRARLGVHEGALETLVASFDEAAWPAADLVNAGFSLPFCPREHFPRVWEKVVASMRPGGRFSGHLFGDRDGWATETDMTFHTREAAEALFGEFELERFDEVEEDGRTAVGEPKRWHVFHVVARRARASDVIRRRAAARRS